jgi:hypothetical protein
VGANIEEGRRYLLEHGIETITTLTRENGTTMKKIVPLQ